MKLNVNYIKENDFIIYNSNFIITMLSLQLSNKILLKETLIKLNKQINKTIYHEHKLNNQLFTNNHFKRSFSKYTNKLDSIKEM